MTHSTQDGRLSIFRAYATGGIVKGVVPIVPTIISTVSDISGLEDRFVRIICHRWWRLSQLLVPRVVCQGVGRRVVVQPSRLRGALTANSVIRRQEDVAPGAIYQARVSEDMRRPSKPFNFFQEVQDTIRGRIVSAKGGRRVRVQFTLQWEDTRVLNRPHRYFKEDMHLSYGVDA